MREQNETNGARGYDTEAGQSVDLAQPMAPTPSNTIREISIRQLSHGYMVQVGCQTFAIETPSALITKLSEYILNPTATERKWDKGVLF